MTSSLPRLKRRKEFVRATRAGRRFVTAGFVLQSVDQLAAGETRGPRVGFTASKKVGNAVARNRARRRLRALAAEVLPAQAKCGKDYVLIARTEILTRPFARLRAELERAVTRIDDERRPRS